jgi:hypothetical protein
MALLTALGNIANLLPVHQNAAHHREHLQWTRRTFAADTQALKIDLLAAARDDVRGNYDTNQGRLNSLIFFCCDLGCCIIIDAATFKHLHSW